MINGNGAAEKQALLYSDLLTEDFKNVAREVKFIRSIVMHFKGQQK